MRDRWIIKLVTLTVVGVLLPAFALPSLAQRGGRGDSEPAPPTPRLADGTVNLGGDGIWNSGEPRARVCATNVAFGDADNRGLYITACTHLFKLRVNVPGVRYDDRPIETR